MGQKINQKIFRIGYKNNNWFYIYSNDLKNKYPDYLIQSVFIEKFLLTFFYSFNIFLNDIKFIFISKRIILNIKFYTLISLNKVFFIKIIKKFEKKKNWFLTFLKFNFKKFYFFLILKISFFFLENLKKNDLTFLTSFVKEKFALNLSTEYQEASYLKLKLQLKKYLITSFFKECFFIIFSTVKLQGFSNLLAFYIKLEFSKLKKHNFFLNFLKRALIFFLYSSLSNIKGIKILVKGRLNGRPRSSKRLITVGRVPSQSFESNIFTTKVTAFSVLGTFGIKVWVCEN